VNRLDPASQRPAAPTSSAHHPSLPAPTLPRGPSPPGGCGANTGSRAGPARPAPQAMARSASRGDRQPPLARPGPQAAPPSWPNQVAAAAQPGQVGPRPTPGRPETVRAATARKVAGPANCMAGDGMPRAAAMSMPSWFVGGRPPGRKAEAWTAPRPGVGRRDRVRPPHRNRPASARQGLLARLALVREADGRTLQCRTWWRRRGLCSSQRLLGSGRLGSRGDRRGIGHDPLLKRPSRPRQAGARPRIQVH